MHVGLYVTAVYAVPVSALCITQYLHSLDSKKGDLQSTMPHHVEDL